MGELHQDLADTIAVLRSGRADGDPETLNALRVRLEGLEFRLKDVFDAGRRAEVDRLHADAVALWKELWRKVGCRRL